MSRAGAILAAAAAGSLLAIGIGSAGAANQTVTLGSVTGSPTGNICLGGTCTYLPFASAASPELQVPFDGTVTSFSVNAGSAGGTVHLRVLRPAGNGQYTGVGTGPADTLSIDVSTFAVSIPVRAGDLLALDNDSSALVFDTSQGAPLTAYYSQGLADGQTAAPNLTKSGYRLLLSASVQATGTVTTTTAGTTTKTTTTKVTTTPLPTPGGAVITPKLSQVGQSHTAWREIKSRTPISGKPQAVGTTFSFTLNESGRVALVFKRLLSGRLVKGRCVAQGPNNRRRPPCQLGVSQGTLSLAGHRGANSVFFQGRIGRSAKLPAGRYTVVIRATDSAGRASAAARLGFTILS